MASFVTIAQSPSCSARCLLLSLPRTREQIFGGQNCAINASTRHRLETSQIFAEGTSESSWVNENKAMGETNWSVGCGEERGPRILPKSEGQSGADRSVVEQHLGTRGCALGFHLRMPGRCSSCSVNISSADPGGHLRSVLFQADAWGLCFKALTGHLCVSVHKGVRMEV